MSQKIVTVDGQAYALPLDVADEWAATRGVPVGVPLPDYPEPFASILREQLAKRGIMSAHDILAEENRAFIRQAVQAALALEVKRLIDHARDAQGETT